MEKACSQMTFILHDSRIHRPVVHPINGRSVHFNSCVQLTVCLHWTLTSHQHNSIFGRHLIMKISLQIMWKWDTQLDYNYKLLWVTCAITTNSRAGNMRFQSPLISLFDDLSWVCPSMTREYPGRRRRSTMTTMNMLVHRNFVLWVVTYHKPPDLSNGNGWKDKMGKKNKRNQSIVFLTTLLCATHGHIVVVLRRVECSKTNMFGGRSIISQGRWQFFNFPLHFSEHMRLYNIREYNMLASCPYCAMCACVLGIQA